MNKHNASLFTVIGFLLFSTLVFGVSSVYAENGGETDNRSGLESDVQSLLVDEKLAIKVWLDPSEEIIATQQINLNIEVSTHRWFLGGTRMGRLEIDDAIVLRRDSFAVNSSRRQKGENWAVQLWTITLYPQRGGEFKVPSIPVTVTVSGENNQPIKGEIYTDELTFSALEPTEIKDKKDWLATTLFEVEDQFDKDITNLKEGDATQRTIRFKAEDMAAMMLPKLSFEKINGVGVYPKPSEIEDTVNRGEYLAERTETINYVIEQSGEYRLPALTFYWWDLNAQQVQTVEIPERILSTLGGEGNEGSEVTSGQPQADSPRLTMKKVLPLITILLLILLVATVVVRLLKKRNDKITDKAFSHKALETAFVEACQQRDYIAAVSLLYQWFDHRALEADKGAEIRPMRDWLKTLNDAALEEQFNLLMEYACSNTCQSEVGGHSSVKNVRFDAMLNQLRQQSRSDHPFLPYARPIHLRLN